MSMSGVNLSIYKPQVRIYSRRKNVDEFERGGTMRPQFSFLQQSSLALAMLTCLQVQASQLHVPIGLQIFTVHDR